MIPAALHHRRPLLASESRCRDVSTHLTMSIDVQHLLILRRVLAVSAWTMLVLIVLGIVLSTDPLEAAVQARQGTPWFDALGNGLLIIMGCAAFALWGAAVFHALSRPNDGRSRALTVVVLIATNVLGGLVYYFFFVRRGYRKEHVDR